MSSWCDASIDVDESAEWGVVSMRKARKEHRCCECGSNIKPGEQYEHAAMKCDGSMVVYKTCEPCRFIRERFCKDGWYYGQLDEQLCESDMGISLRAMKRLWYNQFLTISGLVQLVEELLEAKEPT